MSDTTNSMTDKPNATVVTAGDKAFAWGSFLLVASMRMNGMRQPVIVGAMDWTEEMKRRILALEGVSVHDLAKRALGRESRRDRHPQVQPSAGGLHAGEPRRLAE